MKNKKIRSVHANLNSFRRPVLSLSKEGGNKFGLKGRYNLAQGKVIAANDALG